MIRDAYKNEEFENSIECEHCRKKSQLMIKKTEVSSLPQYLIISFNRFKFVKDKYEKHKIFNYVEVH